MMREKFNRLVSEATSLGFERGMSLFMDQLNEDIERDAQLQECDTDALLDYMVASALTKQNN